MSYQAQAQTVLREAKSHGDTHPWTIVVLLVQAVVYALLAISVAIEALPHDC